MSSTVNRTQQLVEAVRRSRFGSVSALRGAGVPLPQHNSKKTAKKAAAKKPAAKKSTAKKSVAKKTAKKS